MNKRSFALWIVIMVLVISAAFGLMKVNIKDVEEPKSETGKQIEPLVEPLYVIRDNGRYGYINKPGFVVIKPQFEDAYNFSENLARVTFYHKYGYIDKTGKIIIEAVFEDAGDFNEGLAMVGIDNKYGFINKQGSRVVPLEYELVSTFSEGLAGVYANGKWGFINNNGEVVLPLKYENAGSFKDGLAPVSEKGVYGYINKKGEYIIKPQFQYAYNFSEGRAQVGMKGKYGYIDEKGKIVIEPRFDNAMDFSQGLAGISENEKWGFINKSGGVAIKPAYEALDSFSEGMAAVYDGKLWGFINGQGIIVIQPQYEYAEGFRQGLAQVRVEDTLSYIDQTGKVVWHEVEEIAIQGPDGILGRLIKMKIKSKQVDLMIKYPHVVDMKDITLQNSINEILKKQSGVDYKGQPDETFRQDYDVMLNKAGIVSILNTSYMYMKGAAHGMSMRSAINMDMTNGRLYELKELFKPGVDYKSKLNTIIKKKLAEEDIPLLREFDGINDKQEYYLTDKELVVYYQLYDYTPYAYGFLEFYIPYESIRDIIDKEGPIGKIMNQK